MEPGAFVGATWVGDTTMAEPHFGAATTLRVVLAVASAVPPIRNLRITIRLLLGTIEAVFACIVSPLVAGVCFGNHVANSLAILVSWIRFGQGNTAAARGESQHFIVVNNASLPRFLRPFRICRVARFASWRVKHAECDSARRGRFN